MILIHWKPQKEFEHQIMEERFRLKQYFCELQLFKETVPANCAS